jgi:hypothetical protein
MKCFVPLALWTLEAATLSCSPRLTMIQSDQHTAVLRAADQYQFIDVWQITRQANFSRLFQIGVRFEY